MSAGCSRYATTATQDIGNDPNSCLEIFHTGSAPSPSTTACTTNSKAVEPTTQYNGTSGNRMKDVWSPKRLRPINVTNGALPCDSNHTPWSYKPKSYAEVPSPK